MSKITKEEFLLAYNSQFVGNKEGGEIYDKYKTIIDLGLLGVSQAIQGIFYKIKLFSEHSMPVLIHGDTGTGKELVANAIHKLDNSRKDKPFVAINCAGLSSNFLESELFGHKKGSFTGASENKEGLLAKADGGTLFLDELSDMPLEVQAKLLRALNNDISNPTKLTFSRLGDTQEQEVDVRIVAATQRFSDDDGNLLIREDLLARLNRLHIYLLSLELRLEDVSLLIYSFVKEYNQQNPDKKVTHITKEFMFRLFDKIRGYDPNDFASYGFSEDNPRKKRQPFRGNVRALQSYVYDGCIFSQEIDGKRLAWFHSLEFTQEDWNSNTHRSITEPILRDIIRDDEYLSIDKVLWQRVHDMHEQATLLNEWTYRLPETARVVVAKYQDKIGWKFENWEREYWKNLYGRNKDTSLKVLAEISGKSDDTVKAKLEAYVPEKIGKNKSKK